MKRIKWRGVDDDDHNDDDNANDNCNVLEEERNVGMKYFDKEKVPITKRKTELKYMNIQIKSLYDMPYQFVLRAFNNFEWKYSKFIS